ncbi:hypothetical protein ANN_15643 [Periplaneta americana]|uniref:Reverse transcriptase/retrotransposon-derived protein RNase H-like domain-containing protein n=1 Tax=Periplaneta americana TaxID=6978 RepID=A0ABQ8SHM5_PERAM|nr:hypothetical protein ANN_15643 [Periplaneta americana]
MQYHYTRPQNAVQEKNESPEEFCDRVRRQSLRTIVSTSNKQEEIVVNQEAERRVVTTFIHGLRGVRPDPKKIKAIQDYPRSQTTRDIRSFIGLASHYQQHILNFADITRPLMRLTRKDIEFKWEDDQEEAFVTLKTKLSEKPLLIYPDFSVPFIVTTDESQEAVDAVLAQRINGEEKPVAYCSRQLNAAERNYSCTEIELLAVIFATKQFRCTIEKPKQKTKRYEDDDVWEPTPGCCEVNENTSPYNLRERNLPRVNEHESSCEDSDADGIETESSQNNETNEHLHCMLNEYSSRNPGTPVTGLELNKGAIFLKDRDILLTGQIECLPRRIFMDRGDPFHSLSEMKFKERFRLSKKSVLHIVEELNDRKTMRAKSSLLLEDSDDSVCDPDYVYDYKTDSSSDEIIGSSPKKGNKAREVKEKHATVHTSDNNVSVSENGELTGSNASCPKEKKRIKQRRKGMLVKHLRSIEHTTEEEINIAPRGRQRAFTSITLQHKYQESRPIDPAKDKDVKSLIFKDGDSTKKSAETNHLHYLTLMNQ